MHRPKLPKPLHYSAPGGRTQSGNHVPFTNLSPQTPAEQYWASRALKAEALLSAREKHFEEVGKVREEEQVKRQEAARLKELKMQQLQEQRLANVAIPDITEGKCLLFFESVPKNSRNEKR